MELFGSGNSAIALGEPDTEAFLRVDANLSPASTLSDINIVGNVTLVVDGNYNLGDRTQLNTADNATLTLLVMGQTTLSAGANLTSSGSIVRGEGSSATPAVQIFSTFQSNNDSVTGMTVGGNADTHVAVYAPRAAVNVVGGGDIFGAVRSRLLNISGDGGIHFDEALANVTEGGGNGGGTPTPASVNSWFETIN